MKIRTLIIILVLLAKTVSAQNNKILFVMSAADTLQLNNGEKLRQTGVFLNEFYLAYKSVTEAGYTVDFATPNGIIATIDEESINDKYWKNNLEIKKLIKTESDYNQALDRLEMIFDAKKRNSSRRRIGTFGNVNSTI